MAKRVSLVLAMGALLLVLVAGVAVARTFQCENNPCTGTNKDDTITEREGDGARDDIAGLQGDDQILANEFEDDSDLLNGAQGNDRLKAGDNDSRDTIDCGSGPNDRAVVDEGDAVNFSNCERVRTRGGEVVEAGAPTEAGLNEAVVTE